MYPAAPGEALDVWSDTLRDWRVEDDGRHVKGKWNELEGKVKAQWGDLTDDDIAQAEGNIDQLVGKIQQKYGGTKEDIRRKIDSMTGVTQWYR